MASILYAANHPEVQTVLHDCVNRLSELKIPSGILATNTEDAIMYRNWGYQFVAIAVDIPLLTTAARNALTEFHDQ